MRTYTLPANLASIIVNSDYSGSTDEEIQEFEQFCEKEGINSCDLTLPKMEQEPYFARKNDMNNIGGNVLDFLHYTDKEIDMIRDAQNAFNAIIEPGNVRIGIQMWPLVAFEYKMDTGKQIATIPSDEGCDLSELFMAIVDFCINQSGIYTKRDGIVYLAQETDAWFGTSDRNEIGIYTSEELALLSAMKHTGEVLRAENGGYKSIREECENGVYITQYGLDQEVES